MYPIALEAGAQAIWNGADHDKTPGLVAEEAQKHEGNARAEDGPSDLYR